MKYDLPWFSHYSNTHNEPRFQALMSKFGLAGYGRYWVLCEKIAASENAVLDVSSKVIKLPVARAMELREEEFDEFVEFLIAPDIHLLEFANGFITADMLKESYDQVRKKRKKDRDDYHGNKPPTETPIPLTEKPIPLTENIHSIAQDSTAEESKEKTHTEEQKKSECKNLFLSSWKKNPDVFTNPFKIKDVKSWDEFWDYCPLTKTDIEKGMENICKAVRDGHCEKRYISPFPDVFLYGVFNRSLIGDLQPGNGSRPQGHSIASDNIPPNKANEYFRSE